MLSKNQIATNIKVYFCSFFCVFIPLSCPCVLLSDTSGLQHGQVDMFKTVQHSSAVWRGFWELRASHHYFCTAFLLGAQSLWCLPGKFDNANDNKYTSSKRHCFLYKLRCYYLFLIQESIKPVLKQEPSDSKEQKEKERQVAMSVLYHSVSISLCLLSPFMPFLTEELWQRLLPYGADPIKNPTSLCVQPYPKTSQLVRHQRYSY